MKKSITFLLSTAIVTSAIFLFNANSASAATVVTTRADVPQTRLFDKKGKLLNNRALAANTDWITGKTNIVGNITYYQVSTNEYVKASDVSFKRATTYTPSTRTSNQNLTVSTKYQKVPVFNGNTGKVQSWIGNNTPYKVSRVIKNSFGITYYQVSTNGYVVSGLVDPSGTPQKVENIPNFNPARNYYGAEPLQIRYLLVENNNINQPVLDAIPNELLTTEYAISNYAGEDPSGLYLRLKSFYPNL
ncbi:SLAP domain-containing protein [Companilactobacillus zhongbaensis]|uniref:SLAP domain-containing protein n=1 Tax=Companilactobacillus zhongbaensis TaxID=2486009 RepID=UPI000F79F82A|nr:SLAP domain-containing protein [Companilactobacillus zhongbaensis]